MLRLAKYQQAFVATGRPQTVTEQLASVTIVSPRETRPLCVWYRQASEGDDRTGQLLRMDLSGF